MPVDFSRHLYNGALLRQYNHCTQDADSTRSSTNSSRHADTAIALRGFSTTTAAHALRFYTEARFPLNILTPPPPAVRLATCLRRRPIARMHGQHPSGPDFVFSRRPRAGDRRTGTCACARRSPGPVRAGLQNNCAPAITGMCIHQHPPCPLHVRSHVPISACSTRTRTPNAPGPRASRIRYCTCAWACAGGRASQCR